MPGKGKKPIGTRRQEMTHKAEHLSKLKACHFTKQENERLLQLFKEFTKNTATETKRGKRGIDRGTFRDLLHQHFEMTDDVLMDKVFKAFDRDNDGYISDDEWVLGMSTFLKGTMEEQAEFCFCVYSMRQDDGYISREEMFILLKNCLVTMSQEEDPDEMPKDLVELTLKKMDFDHDGRLSKKDYVQAVDTDPLMMESLGPCLPNTKCRSNFLTMVDDDKKKHSKF